MISLSSLGQSLPTELNSIDRELLNSFIQSEVNKLRTEVKLDPVENDSSLRRACLIHSEYMSNTKKIDHYEKKKDVETPKNRVEKFGGLYSIIGENIQSIQPSTTIKLKGEKKPTTITDYERLAKCLVENWRNSEPHYRNIISPDYHVTYCDFYVDKKGYLYATQLFGNQPYEYPEQVEFIPEFEPTDQKKCKRCDLLFSPNNSNSSALYVQNDSIFFYSEIKKKFKKIIKTGKDGLAADIVLRSQFNCNAPNQTNGALGYQGFLLKPIYKKEILKKNPYKKDHVGVFLGMVPEWIDEEYEINLTIILNKRSCVPIIYYHVGATFVYEPEFEYKIDTLQPLFSRTVRDSSRFRVSFEQGSTETDSLSLLKIKDALDQNFHYIRNLRIEANSSIEGRTEKNIELQETRGKALENLVSQLHSRPFKVEIVTKENFEDFYTDISNSPFKNLAELDTAQLKTKINGSIELLTGLEPMFSNHRYAELSFTTERIDTIIYTIEDAIHQIKLGVESQNINTIKIAQSILFREAKKGLLQMSDLDRINIPETKIYGNALSNMLYLEGMINPKLTMDTVLIRLGRIAQLNPKNRTVNTNYAMLLMDEYVQKIIANPNTSILSPLKKIEKMKSIDKVVMSQIRMSALIFEVYFNDRKGNSAEVEKGLNEILAIIKKGKVTLSDRYQIAQIFSAFYRFNDAYLMMKKGINLPQVTHEQLLYFAKLIYLNLEELKDKEVKQFLKKIADKTGDQFCSYFKNPHINFQILDEKIFKDIHCEYCD